MSAPSHRRPRTRRTALLVAASAAAAVALGAFPLAMSAHAAPDLAHAALPARDGWAASGKGTTGGSAAGASRVFTVSTRAELAKALDNGSGSTPRIIRVKGSIDANTDDDGRSLGCEDYAKGTGYSLASYLKTYDPAHWGRSKVPSGAQESARAAAQKKQAARIVFKVPSNTTIVGVPGTGAGLTGGSLQIKDADNAIVRNLALTDVRDCFPQWDPTDGSDGNWNSAYDALSLRAATHVWADHNTFTDSPRFDSGNPRYFGREYQVHDGALDITNASDLVTVSYNRFTDHDKTMLIGSSDKDTKLRVTLHHNVFQGTVQRAPLARVGQIHLYNNLFETADSHGYAFSYSISSRARAQVVAEYNHWTLPEDGKVSRLLTGDGTGALAGTGNLVNGRGADLVAAYNAANPGKQIRPTVNWRPALSAGLETSAAALPGSLGRAAGAGVLTASGGLAGPAVRTP
ncbi:polysaccharide lyase family 1 protein [Streptomyces sp. G-G2]|uniref:pectate lyase family protein n=1 Tax=Streptomyces sp. G-G2 TaxID=3046201 RepID=UPI0024BA163F|nr:polysaccharide lyase family 1 protein [Streptomyces sp. G-G2]MDJ0380435.1 polysaccharide lyase family 1 protein [Streptomyces sp. G-G2]